MTYSYPKIISMSTCNMYLRRLLGREGLDLLNAYLILNHRPGDRAFNNKYIFLISIDYLIIQAFKVLTAKSKI